MPKVVVDSEMECGCLSLFTLTRFHFIRKRKKSHFLPQQMIDDSSDIRRHFVNVFQAHSPRHLHYDLLIVSQ